MSSSDDAYLNLSGERSGHQYGFAQDPPDTTKLIVRLNHLVALDDPALGGPYGGVAARACMQAMRDAVSELERLLGHSTKLNGLMWKLGQALGHNNGFTKVIDVEPDALVEEAVRVIASKRPRQWVYLVLLPVPLKRWQEWLGQRQQWLLHDDDWNAWSSRHEAEQSARMWRKDELTRVTSDVPAGARRRHRVQRQGAPVACTRRTGHASPEGYLTASKLACSVIPVSTRTETKLAREAAIIEAFGEDLGHFEQMTSEMEAEFAMNWVMGGGRSCDISAARRQHMTTPDPAWVTVTRRACNKSFRRSCWERAQAAASVPTIEELF